MMTEEKIPQFDDVIDRFMAEFDHPTREALDIYIRRYPQYEEELLDFAADWVLLEILPTEQTEIDQASEDAAVALAMSRVQNILFQRNQAADAPISSLVNEGTQLGLSTGALIRECHLDLPLLIKLDRRLIEPGSIPKRLVKMLAALLRRSEEAIAAYFALPPQLQLGRSYLAKGKPQPSTQQQNFRDAVHSSGISKDEKRLWLEEVADNSDT